VWGFDEVYDKVVFGGVLVQVWIPVMALGAIGVGCGALLAVAARFLAVQEDPRVAQATELLPGLNCGACGYAGCADYAKAIVQEGAAVNQCKPGASETVAALAAFMGVEASASDRQVAVVLCGGDAGKAKRKCLYNGVADCADAMLAGGGDKACLYGCIGLGTCARVCPVSAIEVKDQLAVVHPGLCMGCGQCVAACPRDLIKLVPADRHIHILCSSQDKGPAVKKVCTVGCIGCTLCFKTVEGKGIQMKGPLAVVDYEVALDNEQIIEKCPMKTIAARPAAGTKTA